MQWDDYLENRIRELRRARDMTMKQLGFALGVAESTISQYETRKRQPDNETLLHMAEFFQVTVGYLLGAEPKEKSAIDTDDEFTKEFSRLMSQLSPEKKKIVVSQIKRMLSNR